MRLSKKKIAKTLLLPGIIPRVGDLFGSGFYYFSYLVAYVYGMVRILPANHPYLTPASFGTFSVRDVIKEAANNLKFTKHNIDQIVMFFTIIVAIFLLIIQLVFLVIAFFISTAQAADMPQKIEDFFKTNNPEEDLAYRMLDLVFGLEKMFGSKDAGGETFHKGLHTLLEFYSYGILLVGALIIIYFVTVIVNETAQSGTPFGKRFSHAWAPIRLTIFFALLIPLSTGLNTGQYLTLGMAKLGSGLATTGWTLFNDVVAEKSADMTLSGEKREHNVATPKSPELMMVPEQMMIVNACIYAYKLIYNTTEFPLSWDPSGAETGVKAWIVYQDRASNPENPKYKSELMDKMTFQDITDKAKNSTKVEIIFGVKDDEVFAHERGSVSPICGSTNILVSDVSQPGSAEIQTGYYEDILKFFFTEPDTVKYAESYNYRLDYEDADYFPEFPTKEHVEKMRALLLEKMEGDQNSDGGIIGRAVQKQIEDGEWEVPDELKDYGWAGAGIWYNKIAEQNGALVSALHYIPQPVLYPRVMEKVRKAKMREDKNPNPNEIFRPTFSEGSPTLEYDFGEEASVAEVLANVHAFWVENRYQENMTGNVFVDTINVIFGTAGLFEICKNTDAHPLAQLSMVGKSMLESSIRSFTLSFGTGILAIIPFQFSPTFQSASSFFGMVSGIGLLAGFILFYAIPFLAFMYFFFAVGSWVKTIFEAVVAVPIWALGHLRIDGEGVPGQAAMSGYYLLFEIFLRPILIIIGLLAAISVFAAMVKVLNEIFYLAVENVSGASPDNTSPCFGGAGNGSDAVKPASNISLYRGPVDSFFFTILYTIIVYMTGTACFKLIDSIPKEILRWMNAEASTFLDNSGDQAEGMMKYMALAGERFGSKIQGSIGGLGEGVKKGVHGYMKDKAQE